MANEHDLYLNELGIRVLHTNMTDLYTPEKFSVGVGRDWWFQMRLTTMKAGLAGLTDYRSIIYLDADAYLFAPPSAPDPMQDLKNGTIEFVSIWCCSNAPLAVGWFGMKPQQDAFEDMMNLIKIGFSHKMGWGFRGMRIGPKNWPNISCPSASRLQKAYCTDPNTPRWDFAGVTGDKGILFAEYAVVRGTFALLEHSEFVRRIPSYNFWGRYKPWMPDNPCVDY